MIYEIFVIYIIAIQLIMYLLLLTDSSLKGIIIWFLPSIIIILIYIINKIKEKKGL